jgi:hypothetical protein
MSLRTKPKGYSVQKNPTPLFSLSVRVPHDTYLGLRNLAETKAVAQQTLVVEALQGLLDRYGSVENERAA